MNCAYCGTEFKHTFRGPKKFCSKECGMKFHNEKNAKGKICKVCGKHFKGGRIYYCSPECAAVAARENVKKSTLADLAEMKQMRTAPKPKKPKKPKISAAEVETIARAEGLSYGQCVAKYGY